MKIFRLYKKFYFFILEKSNDILDVKKLHLNFPLRYLDVVKKGYEDCNLDKKYLIKA